MPVGYGERWVGSPSDQGFRFRQEAKALIFCFHLRLAAPPFPGYNATCYKAICQNGIGHRHLAMVLAPARLCLEDTLMSDLSPHAASPHDLPGRVAIITGGAGGIGRAI